MLFGAARMFVSFDERRFVSIEKIVVFPVLITVSYWFKIESGQSLFTQKFPVKHKPQRALISLWKITLSQKSTNVLEQRIDAFIAVAMSLNIVFLDQYVFPATSVGYETSSNISSTVDDSGVLKISRISNFSRSDTFLIAIAFFLSLFPRLFTLRFFKLLQSSLHTHLSMMCSS